MSFTLGQLRDLRKARKLSQQQLADALRVGRRTIQRWENGESEEPYPLQMAALEQWAAAGTNGKRKAR
jgi:transcriptional regulator with XRE-family HTH domain